MPALGSNRIFNLAEGRDGALWIRTEQGHLVRYANGVFTACPAPWEGGADCSLREVGAPGYTLLHADRAGALWAGGPGGGVFRVEGSGLREAPRLKAASFPTDLRHNLQTGPGQEVWEVRSRTLYHDGRPVLTLPPDPGGLGPIYRDRDGTVWVGTSRRGELHAFHPARIATFAEGLPSPACLSRL